MYLMLIKKKFNSNVWALSTLLIIRLNAFRALIVNPAGLVMLQDVKDSLYTTYLNIGSDLYQSLLEPIINGKPYQKLTIIPDGALCFIPFEILPTNNTKHPNADFRDIPYLIKSSLTNYAYSTTLQTLFINKSNKKVTGKMFGGFAPSYENIQVASLDTGEFKPLALAVRNGLSPLIHNKSEVSEIADLIGGDIFVGVEASRDNFLRQANKYNILHLAMHFTYR